MDSVPPKLPGLGASGCLSCSGPDTVMGYSNIVCHICEGPLDLGAYILQSKDLNSTREAGSVDWLKDAVGITESEGPSALEALRGTAQLRVVRKVTKPEHCRV